MLAAKSSCLAGRQPQAFSSGPLRTAPRRPAAAQRVRARPTTAVAVRAEISYVMVKPDGVQRGLVGEIISRFERKGFKMVALKMYQTPQEVAEEHYKDLKEKVFYKDLVGYIVSGPVVCMVRALPATHVYGAEAACRRRRLRSHVCLLALTRIHARSIPMRLFIARPMVQLLVLHGGCCAHGCTLPRMCMDTLWQ